jgi:RNA polymerase sigma-70 factor (ECF subfamily)
MGSGVDHLSSTIEGIVARFRTLVRGVGVRRGLVDSDLDDVLQDVRIRLWQAGEAGKSLDDVGSSYLYRLATTAAIDIMRRRRAHGGDRSDDVDDRPELASPTQSPDEQLESRELAQQIEAALETLSMERRVAVRFHLAGYDRDDISRALGWSEAKTRNLLYRGLGDLRRKLTALGITPRRLG